MRYMLIITRFETEIGTPDVAEVILCKTTEELAVGLRKTEELPETVEITHDWHVYEVVDGRPVRRAILGKRRDGVLYDVEIC